MASCLLPHPCGQQGVNEPTVAAVVDHGIQGQICLLMNKGICSLCQFQQQGIACYLCLWVHGLLQVYVELR